MKQRLFSLMLVIVANMGLVSAQNTSGKCGDNLIWKISLTDYSLTISGTGNMTSYSVDNSSPWPNNITSVIIENGVSSIGDYAFYDCSKITSITIPNSITSIGDCAFYNCRGLTSITIPNSVTSIGRGTFFGCSSLPVIDNIRYADTYIVEAVDKTLSTYTIKEGTKWIEYYAFNRCRSLTSITIPNSVISIGEGAFEFCSSLTSVNIPSSVTSIGKSAFYECSSLTSVTIPSSVTNIGDNAFSNCKINKIDFNGTIEDWCNKSWNLIGLLQNNSSTTYPPFIPFSLYINGTIVTDLVIPNSVTSIGVGAFTSCGSLTSITIPNSVTSIGEGAFQFCSSLTSVTIGNSVTSIGEGAFQFCSSLTSVNIPSRVTSIGEYAFYNCSSLISVTIPNGVTSIGNYAFENCSSLKEIFWNAKYYPDFSERSKAPFSASREQITSFTFGDEVEHIPAYLCYAMTNLSEVTIPNSVTSIGEGAFLICSSLTSVTIGNSVTSIGEDAFLFCSSLTGVFISYMAGWCNISFGNAYANPLCFAHNLYLHGELVTDLIIPNGVISIGDNAFSYCRGLTSVTIPSSVTSIGDNAFSYCRGLTSVTIPSSVTSIGDEAFSNCKINKIDFKGTIEEWCNKSWNPQNISSSYSLYFNGSIVNKVVIPENYTNIGQNAFFGCSNLTSVAFASSVKVIESGAFQGCNAIDTITCYSMRPPTVEENAFEKLPLSTIVYVPADYMTYYQVHEFWGLYDVRPISTTEVETEEVTITPTDNTVDIVWPTITGAATYELIIRDTDGNIVCTLIFDAQGHLTQIAFAAPARTNVPEQTQAAGFSFTVTGLNSGTTYDYTLTAKDAAGNVLDTKTGTFTTDGLTGIEDIPLSIDFSAPRKVLIDGQLYIILPDNTRYNLQGTEVK